MKVLSLFDGISCARVALEKAGIPVEKYYASEVDLLAMKISMKNWPDIIQVGDVKKLKANSAHKGFFPAMDWGYLGDDIDLLIGGSPCQDLSIATKNRKGLEGSRSGLFWEYVRVLKQCKPKYFILENVASMPAEAKAVITKALGVEPIMINASLVSAQVRKRLFWTNIPGVVLPEDRGILLKDILEEKVNETYFVDGVALRNRGEGKRPEYNGLEKANAMTTVQTDSMVRIGQIGKGMSGRIYDPKGKSVTLSAGGGGMGAKTGLYLIEKEIRKLTTVECERLQGLPDRYTEGVSNTQRYKMLGNAFNADVVAHILSFIHRDVVYKGK